MVERLPRQINEEALRMREPGIISRFREISPERKEEFMSQGLKGQYFFSHRAYYLPKFGPDGLKMSRRMCGAQSSHGSWEVVLYATGPQAMEFPEDLYFDNDVVWHGQQFGKSGHVATANLVVLGKNLYGNNYLSDLVQRISRRREYKTRIENHFRGWAHMLLNAILNFAMEQQLDCIFSPTADFVLAQVPADRHVDRRLFDRIYDRTVMNRYHAVRRENWWVIDVRENRERLVIPVKGMEVLANGKTICVCHDIERGFGHIGIDRDRVQIANRIAPGAVTEMLGIEESAGVKATYNVLGCFFGEVREEIGRSAHCLAFHSYDHQVHRCWQITKHCYRAMRLLAYLRGVDTAGKYQNQLLLCRLVDMRVRGFRPPRSRRTAEWSDSNLALHNFEWFATSAWELGSARPVMQNRLVKIPIHFDDFPLYKQGVSFGDWEKKAMATIKQREYTAFGLHDCYAELWLPHYRDFLTKLEGLAEFKTLDQVANETILANAI